MDALLVILLKLLLALVSLLLFVGVIVGFAVKGPTRAVKIATVLLILSFFACELLFFGAKATALSLVIMLGSTAGAICVALSGWRQPIDRVLREATSLSCPPFARKDVDRWTRELIDCGFEQAGDRLGTFKMHGKDHDSFIRFMRHHSEPAWAEIHAVASPKVCARTIVSAKGEEGAVLTVDQQSDQEVLDDPQVYVQRVPRKASCRDMFDKHRVLAGRIPGRYLAADDPIRAHRWVFYRWAQRLVDSGEAIKDGELIRIPPALFPRLMLRMCTAWFH